MAVTPKDKPESKADGRDARSSRRRVELNVAISIVAAAALAVIVNVISDRAGYRRDVETLGSYGLSETAQRILDQVDQPLRLTTIYASARPESKSEQYLPRVRDLLEEMRHRNDRITPVYVTSDREKAEVVERLRQRLDEAAGGHIKVIGEFWVFADRQAPLYEQLVLQWSSYPAHGWLGQFGMAKAIESAFNDIKESLRKLAAEQRASKQASALPDYPGQVTQITEAIQEVKKTLAQIDRNLRDLAELPELARKSSPDLTRDAKAVTESVQNVTDAIVGTTSAPSDAGAKLDKAALAAERLADSAEKVAQGLSQLNAGGYVEYARAWRQDGSLLNRYQELATVGMDLSEQMRGLRKNLKPEALQQVLPRIREILPRLLAGATQAEKAVAALTGELVAVDAATVKIFAQARKGDYLQLQTEPIDKLVQSAGKLPALEKQGELISQISQDNIVLVEVGEQTGVLSFDEVWPLAGAQEPMTPATDAEPRRVFYGDMAISSKILGLSSPPLAQVVLTYFERVPPQQFWQQMPPVVGPIYSRMLGTLRERLEKANLKVSEWNLAEHPAPPADDADEARPGRKPPTTAPKPARQVLLVLPPPEPAPMPPVQGMPAAPQWSEKDLANLASQIDQGTPAIFLAGCMPTRGPAALGGQYPLGEYLREQWGLDVRTNLRVIQGEPDPLTPGTYTLPILRWSYLPLSSFTNHPIGRPLQARRMYWLEACPIVPVEGKNTARYEPILVVPGERADTWATAQAEKLLQKLIFESATDIKPDPNAGDLLGPFDLAVEAVKEVAGQERRIVVLGVGFSYIDEFLSRGVRQLRGETSVMEPPPTADADLVINAVYHLAGQDRFIGAGPALVKPIGLIPERTMTAIKLGFGLGWPAVMLVLGGVVMAVRRR